MIRGATPLGWYSVFSHDPLVFFTFNPRRVKSYLWNLSFLKTRVCLRQTQND